MSKKQAVLFPLSLILLYALNSDLNLILAQEPTADDTSSSAKCTCSELMRTITAGDLKGVCHFVKDNPNLFTVAGAYCLADLLDPTTTTVKDFCKCDCRYGHGANGEATVCTTPPNSNSATVGCYCRYKSTDTLPPLPDPSNPCPPGPSFSREQLGNAGTSGLNNNITPTTKCSYGSPGKRKRNIMNYRNCFEEPCKTLFQGVILPVVCDIPFGKFKLKLDSSREDDDCPLSGCDICALDCYCVHGADKPPYGMCAQLSGSADRFCYCLYEKPSSSS